MSERQKIQYFLVYGSELHFSNCGDTGKQEKSLPLKAYPDFIPNWSRTFAGHTGQKLKFSVFGTRMYVQPRTFSSRSRGFLPLIENSSSFRLFCEFQRVQIEILTMASIVKKLYNY